MRTFTALCITLVCTSIADCIDALRLYERNSGAGEAREDGILYVCLSSATKYPPLFIRTIALDEVGGG